MLSRRQGDKGGAVLVARHRRAHHGGRRGGLVSMEQYLRDDIPCCSPACSSDTCAEALALAPNAVLLPENATHYMVPDDEVARRFPALLQHPDLTGVILMQTCLRMVKSACSRRQHTQLAKHFRDKRSQSIIFRNENHAATWRERHANESAHAHALRLARATASWYTTHLNNKVRVVIVTYTHGTAAQGQEDVRVGGTSDDHDGRVHVLDLRAYIEQFHSNSPTLLDDFAAMEAELSVDDDSCDGQRTPQIGAGVGGGARANELGFTEYLSTSAIIAGINTGEFVRGRIHVFNGAARAMVRHYSSDGDDVRAVEEIVIDGRENLNRAVHGDIVIVQRATSVCAPRVVSVVERSFRDLVATIRTAGDTSTKVLVVPFDSRLPFIRVATTSPAALENKRLVVRIDSWPVASRFPNGHITEILGNAGDVATETKCLLIENTISVPPFSTAQLREMPVNTRERPWRMADDEIRRRRDIRHSHLVFSIDPLGCEDVDDALGVRRLDNGNIELSVHIADVSYFVTPNTFTDAEARARGTTVYLVNGRHDMLPVVLSADLCSLLADQDRYAMSVFWELDSERNVVSTWFGRTVIRSSYQLHYELAQAIFDGLPDQNAIEQLPKLAKMSSHDATKRLARLRDAISLLITTARALKAKRADAGGLELESDEVRFKVSTSDPAAVQGLLTKESLEIHGVVAECMIFANRAVAERISTVFPDRALLRHHPLPNAAKFKHLADIAASHGVSIDFSSNIALAASLDAVRAVGAKDLDRVLRILATEAMTEAAYFNTGDVPTAEWFHYGLGLEHYTHFTSPIRRYADVIVHRQLMASLVLQPNTQSHAHASQKKQKHDKDVAWRDGVDRSVLHAESDDDVDGDGGDGGGGGGDGDNDVDAEEATSTTAAATTASATISKRGHRGKRHHRHRLHHPLLEGTPPAPVVSDICAHINERNRCAKAVQRDSVSLFQALYIKQKCAAGQSTRAPAIVLRVDADAITLYAQEYGLRTRLRFTRAQNSRSGGDADNSSASGGGGGAVYEVPASLFAGDVITHDESSEDARVLATTRVVDGTELVLSTAASAGVHTVHLRVLDVVEVQLSVDESPYRAPVPNMAVIRPTQDRVSTPVDMGSDRRSLVERIERTKVALQRNSGTAGSGISDVGGGDGGGDGDGRDHGHTMHAGEGSGSNGGDDGDSLYDILQRFNSLAVTTHYSSADDGGGGGDEDDDDGEDDEGNVDGGGEVRRGKLPSNVKMNKSGIFSYG